MSIAWFNDVKSPAQPVSRGGAPVGMMAELPVLEKGAILLLRLWCDGEAGQHQVAHDFTLAFGPDRARTEVEQLSDLLHLILSGGRRPLMRHGRDCQCFGGDESAFANLVAAAVVGEREDAMVFALVLMSPDHAFAAVELAGRFGQTVLGLAHALMGHSDHSSTCFTRH